MQTVLFKGGLSLVDGETLIITVDWLREAIRWAYHDIEQRLQSTHAEKITPLLNLSDPRGISG